MAKYGIGAVSNQQPEDIHACCGGQVNCRQDACEKFPGEEFEHVLEMDNSSGGSRIRLRLILHMLFRPEEIRSASDVA
jgi:hypothetical protein